ncbi:hypothetical protein MK489_03840 [Myxococcota bacterium]|nr:hypothetical protein [Myxococcota bacterium]
MRGPSESALVDRLTEKGRSLGAREAEHREGLAEASACAQALHEQVARALDGFHQAAEAAGAPHLSVALSEVRTDDKHLRSVEFDVTRGRYKAIVTAKSRGDVTLVGPFRIGKTEGPCLTFPFEAGAELDEALIVFLEKFVEEAATP